MRLRQAIGDLLSHAHRTDRHDILGCDFRAHVLGEPLPSPAVADGDGHRPLRRVLSHNMPIQFGHDLPGRQMCHAISSTMMLVFVYTSISAAISSDLRTISAAPKFE